MFIVSKEIENLLATEIFKDLLASKVIQIAQINAAVTLLIKAGIDFTLSFNRGTNSQAKQAQLTVNITPTTSLVFVFAFEGGSGAYA